MSAKIDAVVAHDGSRRQPLFALYRSSLATSAAKAVAAGSGVLRWQNSLNLHEVDLSGLKDAWWNLNTAEDLVLLAGRLKPDG